MDSTQLSLVRLPIVATFGGRHLRFSALQNESLAVATTGSPEVAKRIPGGWSLDPDCIRATCYVRSKYSREAYPARVRVAHPSTTRDKRIIGASKLGVAMSRVEILEREIRALSPEEFAELRQWLTEFDAQVWDRQFEMDVNSGKLDALAEKALRAHAADETTKL